jgi:hypothetical protein
MVDIARDPRWGRMVEGAGEDPYLGAAMAAAQVRGFQGEKVGHLEKVLAGPKHFAVADPPLKLVLLENRGMGGTLNHLGVEVTSSEEVEAHKARLVGQGLAVDEQKGTTCCYARQDKFWVSAPGGERWEHYVVLADTDAFAGSAIAAGEQQGVCCASAQAD